MEPFHWDDNFITGLPSVDKQHQHLVSLVNEFGTLLSENTLNIKDLEKLFGQLTDYARYHFEDEEKLMRQKQIDSRHLQEHFSDHAGFLQEVTDIYSGISERNMNSAKYLFEYLTHWLAYHILGEDQNMARQMRSIESGKDSSQAYEEEQRERDSSTEPLLKALNGLFAQISSRNKELIQMNLSLEEQVSERTQELKEANHQLEELSLTDALTGLANRRLATQRFADLWDEAKRRNLSLACIMIDADHFKRVNDSYGHDAGDHVLIELARTLQDSVRTDDVVCRLGGDEFLVICPNTDQTGGMMVGENIRLNVSELRVITGGEPWIGSVSVGVSCRTEDLKEYKDLMKLADQGVYEAKSNGKNCVRMKAM